MTSSSSHPTFEVDARLMRRGVALLWIGGITWLIGVALSTTALGEAARKWIAQMEQSPSEMAQRRMHQLKVAAAAGSKAWREEDSR